MRLSRAMPLRIVTILLTAASAMKAGDFFAQFWPEVNLFVRAGQNTRFYFVGSGTRVKEGGRSDGQLGAHMDFFLAPMFRSRERMHPELGPNKFLMARVGYLYNRTPESTTSPAYGEHTIDVEMTPRFYLPAKVLATDRNRGDLGFSQGEFKPRYRNRLQFERSCETGRTMSLTPYVYVEVFYDWRYNAFSRQRYAAGNVVQFNKHVAVDGYYLRQEDSKAQTKGTNIVGVALQFFVR